MTILELINQESHSKLKTNAGPTQRHETLHDSEPELPLLTQGSCTQLSSACSTHENMPT